MTEYEQMTDQIINDIDHAQNYTIIKTIRQIV